MRPSAPILAQVPAKFFSVVMLVAIVTWMLPLLGLAVTAFRPFTDATGSGWWTVFSNPELTLDNYASALASKDLLSGLWNSILITVPSVILTVTLSAAAAFALIWTETPGRKWIYTLVVALIIVPGEITLFPTLVVLKNLGLVNTFPGVWLSHASASIPFGVFLLGSFFSQIPADLIDAAKVDGAQTRHLLVRVVLPLSGAALASLATFNFLWVWNDLIRALVIIPDPSIRPLTAVLANIAGGYGEFITVQAAAATLLMIPPLIVFLAAQRAFVRGVLTGAVKS